MTEGPLQPEEIKQLLAQHDESEGINSQGSAINSIVRQVRAAQEGFTGGIKELGQDVVTAGRRFVTDPLSLTETSDTVQRERKLIAERRQRAAEFSRAGLGAAYKTGQIGSEIATIAAPGGALAKVAGKAITTKGVLGAVARTVAAEGTLGAASGAIRKQGDVKERLKESGQQAALFIGAGAVAKGIGSALTRRAVDPKKVEIFTKAGVNPRASQIILNNAERRSLEHAEKIFQKIAGSGITKSKQQQANTIENLAKQLDESVNVAKEAGKGLNRKFQAFFNRNNDVLGRNRLDKSITGTVDKLAKENATTLGNKFTKLLPEDVIARVQKGTFTLKEAHQLRVNLDSIIQQTRTAATFGTASKAGINTLRQFRSILEKTIERSMKNPGWREEYKLLKQSFQHFKDGQLLENIMQKSFDLQGNFSRLAFSKAIKKATEKQLFSTLKDTEIRKAAQSLGDIIGQVGTKAAPQIGPGQVLGTIVGGSAAVGAGVGLSAGSGLTVLAALAGGGRLLSTNFGRKLLTRAGKSPKTHQKVMEIMGRMAALEAERNSEGFDELPEIQEGQEAAPLTAAELRQLLGK